MTNKDSNAEIRSRVDSFVEELSALVRKAALESVHDALIAAGAPAPRRPGRPRKQAAAPARRAAGKRGRRSSAAVAQTTGAALTFVKAHPGCTVGDIGAALGVSTKDLRLPLMKLLADRQLRTTGQKRGTRYHVGSRGGGKKKATRKKATRKASRKKASRKKAKRKKAARKTKS